MKVICIGMIVNSMFEQVMVYSFLCAKENKINNKIIKLMMRNFVKILDNNAEKKINANDTNKRKLNCFITII
jgi:hypothetical protein